MCKDCRSEEHREYYSKNKEKVKNSRLLATYGIDLNEYNARLLAQNYQCPLCEKTFSIGSFGPDSPVIDHCHTHGHVRGILCNECNRGLGYFRDNATALRKAAEYLEKT